MAGVGLTGRGVTVGTQVAVGAGVCVSLGSNVALGGELGVSLGWRVELAGGAEVIVGTGDAVAAVRRLDPQPASKITRRSALSMSRARVICQSLADNSKARRCQDCAAPLWLSI
jgi:hypothetical protein